MAKTEERYEVSLSDAEWRQRLSQDQYQVLRRHGTERLVSFRPAAGPCPSAPHHVDHKLLPLLPLAATHGRSAVGNGSPVRAR